MAISQTRARIQNPDGNLNLCRRITVFTWLVGTHAFNTQARRANRPTAPAMARIDLWVYAGVFAVDPSGINTLPDGPFGHTKDVIGVVVT